jgi:DNA topoisomerase-1
MSTRIAIAVPVSSPVAQSHARSVGLCYVNDAAPGIIRRRCGGGFIYLTADGVRIADELTIVRIRQLAIPPAYQRVWICPQANGHLQATGYDALGRKQYRYHAQWQAIRSQTKFSRMLEFAAGLPRLRKQVDRELQRDGLDRDRVLATAVRVLDMTLIRVGNDRYTAQHGSYGLTTLQDEHVDIKGAHLHFHFLGKSKQQRQLHVDDPVLAKIVRRCRDIPGQRLFQYTDASGAHQSIDSADVNAYLHALTGQEITAKDFRTWGGTVHAAVTLARMGPATSATKTERNIVQAAKEVATRLGNRPATSRKYYIHPAVLDAYRDGTLMQFMAPTADPMRPPPRAGLKPEEKAVVALLTAAAEKLRKAARTRPAKSAAQKTARPKAARPSPVPAPTPLRRPARPRAEPPRKPATRRAA